MYIDICGQTWDTVFSYIYIFLFSAGFYFDTISQLVLSSNSKMTSNTMSRTTTLYERCICAFCVSSYLNACIITPTQFYPGCTCCIL